MLISAHYILPITSDPVSEGAVLIRDGVIRDMGAADIMKLRYPGEETRDFGLAAIMPGMVDAHTRMEYSVMRGMVDDLPYNTWLKKVTEKAPLMEMSDWYDSAVLGCLDALSGGITTISDTTSNGASVTAAQKLGLRAVIYREVRAMDKNRIDYAMKMAKKDIFHWGEEVDANRVTIGIAPAHLFSTHPALMGAAAEFAARENLPYAIHLAGSREECNFVRYGSSSFSVDAMGNERGFVEVPPWMPTGVSPVQYALNWGAFQAPRTLVVQAVHVDHRDVATLRQNNVAIATCPRENAQLGMGVAPLDEFLRADLAVGFGTGSPAATNSTDMLTEMRIGMLLNRSVNTRRFLDSGTILELATLGGARALGLDDKVGSLEIGKRADIVAVDLSSSHQAPYGNPISAVVNTCTSSDVLMTMVDGNILFEKNKWHVNVEVARSVARAIEIRGKLRA